MADLSITVATDNIVDLSEVNTDDQNPPPSWQLDDPLPSPVDNGDIDEPPPHFPTLGDRAAVDDAPNEATTVSSRSLAELASAAHLLQPRIPNATARSRKRTSTTTQIDHRPSKQVVPTTRDEGTQRVKKVNYTRDMTDQIMLWFRACKSDGLFNSTKRKDYGPVWDRVLSLCKET